MSHNNSNDEPHSLHTSTQTLELIGGKAYARKLIEWAGTNVLLLTDKDVNTLDSSLTKNQIVQKLEMTFPDFPIQKADVESVISMTSIIADAPAPAAHGFSAGNGTRNTHCIIVMPSDIMTGNKWFGLSSNQEQTTVHNMQGSGEFWFSMFLAHEAHHCRVDMQNWKNLSAYEQTVEGIRIEAEADQFALHVHRHQKSEYLRDWKQARAVGSMNDDDLNYAFAGILPNHAARGEDVIDSMAFIWEKIGNHPSVDREVYALSQTVFLLDNLGIVRKDTSAFDNAVITTAYSLERGQAKNPVQATQYLSGIVNNTLSDLSKGSDPHAQLLAKMAPMAIRQHLSLEQIYKITKDIHQKGGFDENPIARRNVGLFLEGIEQHATSAIKPKPITGLGG